MDTKLEKYISHLQGVVRIPTVSSVNDEHTDWSQFDRLHQYMQEAWPLVFEKMELTAIGKASLLSTGNRKTGRKILSSSWPTRTWYRQFTRNSGAIRPLAGTWLMAASGAGARRTASPC